MTPFDHGLNILLFSLEYRLNPSIIKILHPSGEIPFLSFLLGTGSKKNTLHPPLNKKMSPLFGHKLHPNRINETTKNHEEKNGSEKTVDILSYLLFHMWNLTELTYRGLLNFTRVPKVLQEFVANFFSHSWNIFKERMKIFFIAQLFMVSQSKTVRFIPYPFQKKKCS